MNFIICKQEVYKFCLLNCTQIIFPNPWRNEKILKNIMNTLSDSIIGYFQSSVLNYLLNVKARTIRTKHQYAHILAQLLRASGTFLPLPRKKKKGNSLLYVKLVGNSFTTCQWIKLYYRVTSEINTGQKQDYPTFTMKVMKKPSYEKKYSSINTIHSFIRKTSHRMVKITICCCRLHTKRSIALEVTGLYFLFPSRHSFFLCSSLFQSLFFLSSPILYLHLVLSV